jgi:hypothetical protein
MLAPPELRPWLLMVWMTAWQQSPCGTLPNDDALIAAHIGMPCKQFAASRDVLLRRWWLASDGRLYHPVLTEHVLYMLAGRQSVTDRVNAYRERKAAEKAAADARSGEPDGTSDGSERSGAEGDGNAPVTRYQHVGNALDQTRPDQTRPESKRPKRQHPADARHLPEADHASGEPGDDPQRQLEGVAAANGADVYRVPSCPYEQILAAFHETLPVLPSIVVFEQSRKGPLRARWTEVCAAEHFDRAAGLAWFKQFFEIVSRSSFLTGRSKKWKASFDWLMKPTNFAKVVEGNYRNGP